MTETEIIKELERRIDNFSKSVLDLIFQLKNTNNALEGLLRAKQAENERLKSDLEFYQRATHNLNKELTEREVKP